MPKSLIIKAAACSRGKISTFWPPLAEDGSPPIFPPRTRCLYFALEPIEGQISEENIKKITEAVATTASYTGSHPYEVADNFCANIADAEIRAKLSSEIRDELRKNAHQYPWNL